jgi:hypothetical protein
VLTTSRSRLSLVLLYKAFRFIAFENFKVNSPKELTLETVKIGFSGENSDLLDFSVLLGSIE